MGGGGITLIFKYIKKFIERMDKVGRNLQEIGGSLLVTVPKEWADQFRLKKGSSVEIGFAKDGTLLLAPRIPGQDSSESVSFKYDRFFARRFFSAYLGGADTITIKADQPFSRSQRASLLSFLRKFLNVEVVEDEGSKMVVQNFKIKNLSIPATFRRMFYLTKSMMGFLRSYPFDSVQISEADGKIDKFYFMVVMQVRTYLSEAKYVQAQDFSLLDAMDFRVASEKVERIGDLAKYASRCAKGPLSPVLLGILGEVEGVFSRAVDAFLKQDFEKAVLVWADEERILAQAAAVRGKLRSEWEREVLSLFTKMLDKAKDVADLVRWQAPK